VLRACPAPAGRVAIAAALSTLMIRQLSRVFSAHQTRLPPLSQRIRQPLANGLTPDSSEEAKFDSFPADISNSNCQTSCSRTNTSDGSSISCCRKLTLNKGGMISAEETAKDKDDAQLGNATHADTELERASAKHSGLPAQFATRAVLAVLANDCHWLLLVFDCTWTRAMPANATHTGDIRVRYMRGRATVVGTTQVAKRKETNEEGERESDVQASGEGAVPLNRGIC